MRSSRSSLRRLCRTALVLLSFTGVGRAEEPDELPRKFRAPPFDKMSLTIGHPNAGRQLRAKRLHNAPEIFVREDCREHAYGHPALVLMLRRSAKDVAKAVPGSVMLVGDLSKPLGGPLAGHRSHQSGRDADVGFYVMDEKGRRLKSRKYVSFDGDGVATDGSKLRFDDERNWYLVESWARDRRAGLSHIFVSDPLRKRLLKFAHSRPRAAPYIDQAIRLLKQPEHGEDHDDHFHVRIACPEDQLEICRMESRT